MAHWRVGPCLVKRLGTVGVLAVCCWVHPVLASAPEAPVRTITVVTPENFPPLIYRDASGEVRGMTQDLWILWEARTGVQVDLQPMPWGQAQARVLAGEADVIDLMTVTEVRKKIFDFSTPYMVLDVVLFFDKRITGIVDASSSKGLPVGAG